MPSDSSAWFDGWAHRLQLENTKRTDATIVASDSMVRRALVVESSEMLSRALSRCRGLRHCKRILIRTRTVN